MLTFSCLNRKRGRADRAPRYSSRRPSLERLEERCVLSEVIGPYTVQSAPVSASLVSGGEGITGWLNVVNAQVSYNDAFSGFNLIDRGYANFSQGSVIQMNFAPGALSNGPGPDLLLLDGRYSLNSYSVSTSNDGFAKQVAVSSSALTDTGVGRSYYYQGAGPYAAMVMAKAIDLSDLGVAAGASVASVRVTTTSSEADLLGVGALSSSTKLQSVTFSGAGYHTITSDPNASGGTTDYGTQHWLDVNLNGSAQDAGDHAYPALYEANSTMSVSATWKLPSSAVLGGTIKACGKGSGNFDVLATAVTQSGDILTLAATAASGPFGSSAHYDPHFEIKWQLSFDDGNTWSDAGTSDNTIYVSAAAPLADPDSGKLFETVVFLAISNTAGDSGKANLIADSWGEFTDRSVSRVDSSDQNGPRRSALHYYRSHQTTNETVADLLKDADGQCSTWTKLFLDMLRVNGINKAGDYIQVEPKTDDGFLVKNWDFNPAGGKSTDPTHPYLNIPSGFTAAGYTWKYADVTDAVGIPGQSTTNPASVFTNHQIALINGTYYDPSYGVTYTSLPDMEMKAIAGYVKAVASYRVREADLGVDLNGNGTKTDVLRFTGYTNSDGLYIPGAFLIRKPNLASPNLMGTPSNSNF